MNVEISELTPRSYRGLLNEGPYVARDGAIWWVDILGRTIHRRDAVTAAITSIVAEEKVSAVLEAEDGAFVVTGERRLFRLDQETDSLKPFKVLASEILGNRCNDAKSDPFGNLWFGTMDDSEQADTGTLWCLTRSGELVPMLRGIGVSNTLAWDLSRERMYFADSRRGEIYALSVRGLDGTPQILSKETFVASGRAPGVPDGSAIDSEGCLWNARWDGGCVVCFDPDGHIRHQIDVAAVRPTSCAFAGQDLNTLIVTTASVGLERPGARDGHVLMIQGVSSGQRVPPLLESVWAEASC